MVEACALFTDGSVNPQRRIGIGAVLLLPMTRLTLETRRIDAQEIANRTTGFRFEDTSSTRLEIQTVIRALEEHHPFAAPPIIYSDSQCVAGLPERRPRLEINGFRSGRTGRPINHADLYQQFYRLQDEIGFTVQKVSGHSDYRYQDTVHRIFHYVDREARRLLKQWMRELA